MEVHNMMEDIVLQIVAEVFEEKAGHGFSLAHCYQCQLDVACYVLNRIKPEYIISGRGLAHYESDYQDHIQKNADAVALVNEGIRKIDARRRPYYDQSVPEKVPEELSGPVFNFPAIIGRILHGSTFEPLKEINVYLLQKGKPVAMIDTTWFNPYFIVESTRGNFTFLPRPLPAEDLGDQRTESFEVSIEAEGFSPLSHHFEVSLVSQKDVLYNFSMQNTYKIGELYLFPEDQPMEINE